MNLREFLRITKALADEKRARMLRLLRRQELCVCQIVEVFGLAASTTSKHLSVLYQAGLVNARKEGRWMFYSWPDQGAPEAARQAVEWVCSSLRKDRVCEEDDARLKTVLAMDPSELCKKQCGN